MAASPAWGERLRGWLAAVIELWRMAFPQFRIAWDTSSYVFQEQLEKAYQALPDAERNDPRIKANYDAAKKILPKSQDNIIYSAKKLAEEAGEWITRTYMNITPATPETALAAATTLVALDAAKDISVGLAGLASEVISAGQVETTTDFFKFLRAKTGYGGPMTMLMKAPIELGVISPLSKYLHSQYRDAYLRGQAALVLATKGHITEDQMRKAYYYEGLPEWAIDAVVKDRWRELRLGEIAWALNDAMVDAPWLDEKLKYALYSPEDRPVIIRMIQEKYLRTYRDRVATQIRNMYKEGYISYSDFSARLVTLGIPLKVRNMLASEAAYLYTQDLNADLIATWTTAYRNDIISEDVLRGNLASIIVDPARVEAQVNKAAASRKPKAVAAPKPQTQGVRVASKPSNAHINLDGTDTGKLTPETLETSIGRHTLVIGAGGFEDAAYELELAAGQFVELYAALVPLPAAPE